VETQGPKKGDASWTSPEENVQRILKKFLNRTLLGEKPGTIMHNGNCASGFLQLFPIPAGEGN
jgi:hypothetical protein